MDMADTKLRTSVDIEKNSTCMETAGEGQLQEQEKYTDIEHEIECPRCYDIMVLLSDFDSLYYSCEECGFILYTMKRAS
jgi:Zn finger protein HypA/HybF involved in hydrogenase expression